LRLLGNSMTHTQAVTIAQSGEGADEMKTFTIGDIRKWDACYDPAKYLPEGWKGDAIDILRIDDCPAKDRLWVVLREECIDARTLRLFAVWCAREALKHVKNPDARIIEVCDVAERYAKGEATRDELNAARAAADPAYAAADTAADSAAYAAASSAYAAKSPAAHAAQVAHLIEMLEAAR